MPKVTHNQPVSRYISLTTAIPQARDLHQVNRIFRYYQGQWFVYQDEVWIPSELHSIQGMSGIYHVFRLDGAPEDQYIGQTRDFSERWHEHVRLMMQGISKCRFFQAAWHKYGAAAFGWQILEETLCEKTLLKEREQWYFDTYHPRYNLLEASESLLGYHHTDESRRRMQQSALVRHERYRQGEGQLTIRQLRQIHEAHRHNIEARRGQPWTSAQRSAYERNRFRPRTQAQHMRDARIRGIKPWQCIQARIIAMECRKDGRLSQLLGLIHAEEWETEIPMGSTQAAAHFAKSMQLHWSVVYQLLRVLRKSGQVAFGRSIFKRERYATYWDSLKGQLLDDMGEIRRNTYLKRRGIQTEANMANLDKAKAARRAKHEAMLVQTLAAIEYRWPDRIVSLGPMQAANLIANDLGRNKDSVYDWVVELRDRGDIHIKSQERYQPLAPPSSSLSTPVPARQHTIQPSLFGDPTEEE